MPFTPDIHHRRSIRLKDYDYSQAGAYFVTICTWQLECFFGDIVDGEMRLNDFGRVVDAIWTVLPKHNAGTELDEYTIMPNHFHGIILFADFVGATARPHRASPESSRRAKPGEAGESLASPLPCGTERGSLGAVIQNFKSVSTRKINKLRDNPGCPVWQRNYYERVIRNDTELVRAREYIVNNPLKWELDKENPANL